MCDKQFFLYGAGGHAKVIMDVIEAAGGRIEGVIDDNPDLKEFMGKEVLHGYQGSAPIIVSIGINGIRRKVVEKLGSETVFGTAIHPSAILSPHATVGEGSVVMQGAILQSCIGGRRQLDWCGNGNNSGYPHRKELCDWCR